MPAVPTACVVTAVGAHTAPALFPSPYPCRPLCRHLHTALDGFMDAVSNAYDISGLLDVPAPLTARMATLLEAAAGKAPHPSPSIAAADMKALTSVGEALRGFMRSMVAAAADPAAAAEERQAAAGRKLLSGEDMVRGLGGGS